jgi:aminopeptidase N
MLPKILFLALLLIMSTTLISAQTPPIESGVSQTLAKWRAANYGDVRYKLNLTLEKMSPTLKGTMEISVKVGETGGNPRVSKGAEASNENAPLILDWRKIRGKEDLSTISNVSVNGKPVVLSPDFSRLSSAAAKPSKNGTQNFYEINEHLVFKDGVKSGENTIKLDFTSPIAPSGSAITRYVDKEDNAEYIYSLFVPSDASTAFPVFDQPDLKARFSLTVFTYDKNWKIVSNGKSSRRIMYECQSGKICPTGYSFEETQPISTYVFAFAAGDFAEFSQLPKTGSSMKLNDGSIEERIGNNADSTSIYVRKSQAEKFKQHAAEVFRLNREGVKFLESYFDYKFPFPKYDLVLIPEFPFGGMEHAGATFLRESSVIFPTEPTKNDYVSRANLIFHEAAHQWFGDTVTMKWFDDLWLKEGFAEFMAYKTLEKVMPEYNAWKIFYERNKQAAYLTDSTRGTTPIYQEIPNLSAAKSAYGNIVYRKAPSFLKQAEFYLGEDKFQTAVRAFLKKHEFANAEWTDLVKEFETASKQDLKDWANVWVKLRGMPLIRISPELLELPYETESIVNQRACGGGVCWLSYFWQHPAGSEIGSESAVNSQYNNWRQNVQVIRVFGNGNREEATVNLGFEFFDLSKIDFSKREEYKFTISEEEVKKFAEEFEAKRKERLKKKPLYVFPNYQDYGYGIFLLDEKSRDYVLENIQTEKDDFLRTMMWGALWDSVREAELAPKDYVALVIKNINVETDESTIQTLLGRVSTAMNYYLSDKQREEFAPKIEAILFRGMRDAKTLGQRITFFRAYLNLASTDVAQEMLKKILKSDGKPIEFEPTPGMDVLGKIPPLEVPPLKTKDKFDIVTKLLILENKKFLGNNEAEKILSELEKNEPSDEAKRYAYAARAGIATAENKLKVWNDFINNKDISESWIEAAFVPFNSPKHSELTLPYLEKALTELPNLKRSRKIFFVNGWLSSFIGGQKSEQALAIVNKFLNDNPNLDKDLRLKILETADNPERSLKIRRQFADEK